VQDLNRRKLKKQKGILSNGWTGVGKLSRRKGRKGTLGEQDGDTQPGSLHGAWGAYWRRVKKRGNVGMTGTSRKSGEGRKMGNSD